MLNTKKISTLLGYDAEREALYAQALERAVKNVGARAQALAKAAGVVIGKPSHCPDTDLRRRAESGGQHRSGLQLLIEFTSFINSASTKSRGAVSF